MNFILLIIGFIILIKCADWFVIGTSRLAKYLKIPSLIVGLTIVSLGTSTPEAAISITASLKNMNDLSLGNVVGSNISNLLLVLGICGLFGSISLKKKLIKRDFRFLIFSSLILFLLTCIFFLSGKTYGTITRINGLLLLGFLILYIYNLINDSKKNNVKDDEVYNFNFKDMFKIMVGIIGLIFGSQLIVNSSVEIAKMFNLSERVISLTLISIGSSLPEIVTSVVAVRKGEGDIALGNVVGSNIFNILFILGLSSFISPIMFEVTIFYDVLVMLFATFIIYFMFLKDKHINFKRGVVLLIIYFCYINFILFR